MIEIAVAEECATPAIERRPREADLFTILAQQADDALLEDPPKEQPAAEDPPLKKPRIDEPGKPAPAKTPSPAHQFRAFERAVAGALYRPARRGRGKFSACCQVPRVPNAESTSTTRCPAGRTTRLSVYELVAAYSLPVTALSSVFQLNSLSS